MLENYIYRAGNVDGLDKIALWARPGVDSAVGIRKHVGDLAAAVRTSVG